MLAVDKSFVYFYRRLVGVVEALKCSIHFLAFIGHLAFLLSLMDTSSSF